VPECPRLPASADLMVPHRSPMRLVDSLVAFAGGSGTVEARVPQQGIFVREDLSLEPVALLELMAQAYAAVKGYELVSGGLPVRRGFLVGVRRASFPGRAMAGDLLEVEVGALSAVGPFSIASGAVRRGQELLAEAEMKLWLPEEEPA